MKLLRCPNCNDVIRLVHIEWRTCECGGCGGQYNKDLMSATIGGKCDVIGLSNLFFNEDFRKKTWEEKVEFRKEINHYPAEIWFGEMQGDNQIIRIEDPKGGRIEMDVEFDSESETTKSIITDKREYSVNLADDTKPKELIIHNKMVPSFRDAEMRLGAKSSAVEAITDRTKEQ